MKNKNITKVLLDVLSDMLTEVDTLVKEDGYYLSDDFIKSIGKQDAEAGTELIVCSITYYEALSKISRVKTHDISSLDEVKLCSLLYKTAKAKNDIVVALDDAKSTIEYKGLSKTTTFVEGTNTIPNYNKSVKWNEDEVTLFNHDVESERTGESAVKDAVAAGVGILLDLFSSKASDGPTTLKPVKKSRLSVTATPNKEKSTSEIAQERLQRAKAALGRIAMKGVAKNNPFIIVNDHMTKNGKTYYVPSKLPFANVSTLDVRLSDKSLVNDLDQLTILMDYLTGDLFGNIVANRANNSPIIDEYVVTINPQCESYKVLLTCFEGGSVDVDELRDMLSSISWGLFDRAYLDSSNIVFVIGLKSKFQQ